KARANVRHSTARAERDGVVVTRYGAEERTAIDDAQLTAISDAWLATKHGPELGFTLGRFDPEAVTLASTYVARPEVVGTRRFTAFPLPDATPHCLVPSAGCLVSPICRSMLLDECVVPDQFVGLPVPFEPYPEQAREFRLGGVHVPQCGDHDLCRPGKELLQSAGLMLSEGALGIPGHWAMPLAVHSPEADRTAVKRR